MNPLKLQTLGIFVIAALGILATTLLRAQTTPSAEHMIEQLQTPKTRGLTRSFGVVDRSQQASPAVQPVSAAEPSTQAPAPVIAAPPAPPASVPSPANSSASLSLHIQFEFDSAKVNPSSQQALKNLAVALASRSLSESQFMIEGHTDAQGRQDYNKRLSAQRADAVKTFLMVQGVASARLNTVGKGSDELANAQDPRAAENRRVKIINLD